MHIFIQTGRYDYLCEKNNRTIAYLKFLLYLQLNCVINAQNLFSNLTHK